MPEEYTALVAAMKALTQGESPNVITLPMAENGWNTRPNTESYGIVSLDFEADALVADNEKLAVSHEGSVDLYSRSKTGAGWIPLITAVLKNHCGPCWSLNSHTYESESRLFHWEWTFEVGE